MVDEYFTIKKPAQHTLIIKKSKFLSNVLPVVSQSEAEEYINSFRKKYWDATHNVYAYSIGLNDEIQKFSDDGEPSGTAGKPVLEVIKSREVKNVLIIVTRYFGGILLGAGGLVRAYSESTAIGLKKADVIKKIRCDVYEVKIDYSHFGKLQREIEKRGLIVEDIKFGQEVLFNVCVPVKSKVNFKEIFMNTTSGKGHIEFINQCFI